METSPDEAPSADTEQGGMEAEVKVEAMNFNIAENLDEEKRNKIGSAVKTEFDSDEISRKFWLEDTREWLDLAMQIRDEKSYPWPNASNVKYPLISTAALQFNARAYPTLVPSDGNLVKTRVTGRDADGEKAKKGERVAKFMSWQFMQDMETWDEDMDRMFIMLPVCGIMFKKTYFSHDEDKVVSKLVYPENFVIDYWSHQIEEAERYSEVIHVTPRVLKNRQRRGDYLDIDLGTPPLPDVSKAPSTSYISAPSGLIDTATPYKLIEQYRWEDLDDDGVMEPYIVTIHYESGKVLRISPHFTPEDMEMDGKKVVAVKRHEEYYTKYGFIPNPDGSFYDLGFGHLLGPINESVNTLVNQLVDSGTLHNLQSGFVGKGLKLKMGDQPMQPGEWKAVNATADDLRKQIVPLPTKEPSKVLFELFSMLLTSGKELASVAEIFVGKMPGQNTPATTTMATIEQGMKVFTAIYKRVFRSLQKEFKKVYKLNGLYLDPNTYSAVLDENVGPEDFQDTSYDICPTADPTATTQAEKLMKAQALMELLPSGMLDPAKVLMRVLQAQDQPNWEELIPGMAETGQPAPKPEQPDPKMLEMQAKQKLNESEAAQRSQENAQKHAMEMQSQQAKVAQEAQRAADKRAHENEMARIKAGQAAQAQKIFIADAATKLQVKAVEGKQKIQQKQAEGEQKLQQMKQQKQLSKSSSSGGKAK